MLCPKCSTELLVDHVVRRQTPEGEITDYYYVCRNPQCADHLKTYSAAGEAAETTIR